MFKKILAIISTVTVLSFAGCGAQKNNISKSSAESEYSGMSVTYLNVGQGDSELIQVNGINMLIDAGTNAGANDLVKDLKNRGIKTIDIAIATHPHEDHIGGMVDVFKEYEVKAFYSPKITHTTKTYENLVKAVKDEGLKTKELKGGMVIDLGEGAKFEVFTPQKSEYEELNDYSPIMKLSFGDTSYLFTGDAEKLAEEEALAKYKTSLDSDVIKFGHHGSSSSSSNAFIEAVSPKYGIISCAKDNKYGHPHRETLDIIKKYNIKTFRTDTDGEIILTSDGKSINFNK